MHRRKSRREQGAFLIEGVRLVRDALIMHAAIRQVVLCPESLGEIAQTVREEIAAALDPSCILMVTPAVMRSIADTETPQGVVAVADLPRSVLPTLDGSSAFVLILDGVRDPGNVGTLIRAAAAAGCDAVVAIAGSADAFAPKVVRSAMGAHFHVPIVADMEWEAIGSAIADLPSVYGADGASSLLYDAVDWTHGCAIVVGNEDHGLSAAARMMCKGTARIPMARGVESLNASVAGAILLYEAVRQRRYARISVASP